MADPEGRTRTVMTIPDGGSRTVYTEQVQFLQHGSSFHNDGAVISAPLNQGNSITVNRKSFQQLPTTNIFTLVLQS